VDCGRVIPKHKNSDKYGKRVKNRAKNPVKLRLLTILTLILYATCAHANEEDREERRELRDRREKVRGAIRRMEKCIQNRDLSPCIQNDDDAETHAAVMTYFMKRGKPRRPAKTD